MTATLPPLRLTGATVLSDGKMAPRTVAVAGGLIASGPFPAVDLSGYLILPGIVDLCGEEIAQQADLDGASLHETLAEAGARAARAGITTAWLRRTWTVCARRSATDHVEAILEEISALPCKAIDLRAHIGVERLAVCEADKLAGLVRRHGVDLVSFQDTLSRRLIQAQSDEPSFAAWANKLSASPSHLRETLENAQRSRHDIPRTLCALAQSFDRLGVRYGSSGDLDGETRETYAILGAKLCFDPESVAAAGVAQALGDPVILPARDALSEAPSPRPARALMRARRCRALSTGGELTAPIRAALTLWREQQDALPALWDKLSRAPAQIMGLPDRGEIAPGKRADLIVVNPRNGCVEATLSNGKVAHMCGHAAARFITAGLPLDTATK